MMRSMSSSTPQKFPAFTDLGRDLIDDKKGKLHKSLLEAINLDIAEKEEAMAKGLPMEKKGFVEAQLLALKAAARTINLFWHSAHHKPS